MRFSPYALTAASFLFFASCVSDEGTVRPTIAPGGSSDGGSTSKEDGGVSPVDASVQCMASEKNCGGSCVDTLTASENCGDCGKSCGGGTCTSGVCGPVIVRADIPAFGGYAVEAGKMFFTSDTKVNGCSADACKGAPIQLADMLTYPALNIEVDNGFIAFESAPNQNSQRPALYRCPISGCTNPPDTVFPPSMTGFSSFHMAGGNVYANLVQGIGGVDCPGGVCGAQSARVAAPVGNFAVGNGLIYFQDRSLGGDPLRACPLSEVPCVTRMTVTTSAVKGAIVLAQDLVLFVGNGNSGGDGVLACPKTGACGNPTPIAKLFSAINSLAADAQGIYWASEDKVSMCANATCTGGPKLVQTAAGSSNLRLTPKFVYYTVPGASDAGPGSTTIMRIAR